MKEGTPRDIHEAAAWAVDRIAERMQQQPVPIHPGGGIEGHGFKVINPENPADARTIGIFPDQRVVTITAPDVSITINNARATAAKDGIHVDAGEGSLRTLFLRDGHIAVEVFPAPSLALPDAPLDGEHPSDEDSPDLSSPTLPGAPGDAQTASQETTETPQSNEQKERQPRVKITGRLGADPHYEESKKSGLIARFPVAEQTTEEQATWHRVYTTGDRAGRVREANLGKGDTVRVDGYQQMREVKRRDGCIQHQVVVYAALVTKLGGRATAQAAAAPENEAP